eukprot:2889696-Amphidinium_carterae.1
MLQRVLRPLQRSYEGSSWNSVKLAWSLPHDLWDVMQTLIRTMLRTVALPFAAKAVLHASPKSSPKSDNISAAFAWPLNSHTCSKPQQ